MPSPIIQAVRVPGGWESQVLVDGRVVSVCRPWDTEKDALRFAEKDADHFRKRGKP